MTENYEYCNECGKAHRIGLDEEPSDNYYCGCKIKLLSKIGDNSDSQTERCSSSSDKEVAQPYSKSDKTTKEIGEEKQNE